MNLYMLQWIYSLIFEQMLILKIKNVLAIFVGTYLIVVIKLEKENRNGYQKIFI